MNYKLHYQKLIDRARLRTMDDDTVFEIHHILPKCIYGTDQDDNLVALTPEEHLLAHILLTKIYPYEGLMLAVVRMLASAYGDNNTRASFNKKYGFWRKKSLADMKGTKWWHNGTRSQRAKLWPGDGWEPGMGNDAWNKGIKTGANPEHSARMKGRAQPVKTDDARSNSGHKGTVWFTNGARNMRGVTALDDNWYQGFTSKKSGSKGMKWWNDGTKCILSHICPPMYVSGRLLKKLLT